MMHTRFANYLPYHVGFQWSIIEFTVYNMIALHNPEQFLIIDTSHIHSRKGRMYLPNE